MLTWILSEFGGFLAIKEEQRRLFLSAEDVFAPLQTGFGKSLLKRHTTSRLATGWRHARLVLPPARICYISNGGKKKKEKRII